MEVDASAQLGVVVIVDEEVSGQIFVIVAAVSKIVAIRTSLVIVVGIAVAMLNLLLVPLHRSVVTNDLQSL